MSMKEQEAQLLKTAASVLRTVTAERDEFKIANDAMAAELAAYRTREDVAKVASEMRAKGLNADMSDEDLHANLTEAAETGKLAAIREGVKLAGPNISFGSVSPDKASGGLDPITRWILELQPDLLTRTTATVSKKEQEKTDGRYAYPAEPLPGQQLDADRGLALPARGPLARQPGQRGLARGRRVDEPRRDGSQDSASS